MRMRHFVVVGFMIVIAGMVGFAIAQDDGAPPNDNPNCFPEVLAQQQQTFADLLKLDFEAEPDKALANMYRLGAQYQLLAAECGYEPGEQEIQALVDFTLSVTDLETIIAANAVGTDVAEILAAWENAGITGDPQRGQLLYNGLEPVLDGTNLGCAGCHNGQTAPATEGTWTRVNDIHLQEAQFADYTVEQYLVESIVMPDAYVVPDFLPGLMPNYFGSRLDEQMLADIVAYLDSQDQLLDE
jgi:hypothetical protein